MYKNNLKDAYFCVLLHHSQRKHVKYHWRRSLARVIYCLEKTRPVSLGEVTFTSHSLLGENTSSIIGGGHFQELFTAWRKQVQYHWGRSLSRVIHCLEKTCPVSLGKVTFTSHSLFVENTSSIIGGDGGGGGGGGSLSRIIHCLEETSPVSLRGRGGRGGRGVGSLSQVIHCLEETRVIYSLKKTRPV